MTKLLDALRFKRDKAMILLMLHGGLRPGEVLNLRLEDIQYGRKRVVIRYRTDHPKGVRTKSRVERLVDLHQPETLLAVSDYVMHERPTETDSPYVFLVEGTANAAVNRWAIMPSSSYLSGTVNAWASAMPGSRLTLCATRTRRRCGKEGCANSRS